LFRPQYIALAGALLISFPAMSQSLPTATVGVFPSVFAGATGVRTGFNGGKNLAITGGLDVGFYAGRRFEVALEYRGSYPIDRGSLDSQKSNLVGVVFSRSRGPIHPYGEAFWGRAEIDYAGTGAQVPGTPIFYTQSSSNVFAGGGGVLVDLGPRFALKLDALFQRCNTPVTASGHIYPQSGTLGIVYRMRPGRVTGKVDR
jgi:hypothetical protein